MMGGLAGVMADEFGGAAAEAGIRAQGEGTQPVADRGAVGQQLGPDGLIDGGIIIGEQRQQRGPLARGQRVKGRWRFGGLHTAQTWGVRRKFEACCGCARADGRGGLGDPVLRR